MRLSEEMPMDPDVLAELEAIDATLRGEAVDPIHADLAELALLLADQRTELPADAARSLDASVARRFAPADATANADGDDARTSQRPRNRRWALRPAFGIGLAGLAAVAIAAVIVVNGNSSSPALNDLSSSGNSVPPAAGSVAGSNSSVVRHAAASTRADKRTAFGPAGTPHSTTGSSASSSFLSSV